MTHRRIANLAYSAIVTCGCAVSVGIGILESRPPQAEEGVITFEKKIDQRPAKPKRLLNGIGKKYITYDELDAALASRKPRASN